MTKYVVQVDPNSMHSPGLHDCWSAAVWASRGNFAEKKTIAAPPPVFAFHLIHNAIFHAFRLLQAQF